MTFKQRMTGNLGEMWLVMFSTYCGNEKNV